MEIDLRVLLGPAASGKTSRVLEAFVDALKGGGEPLLILPSSYRVSEVRLRLVKEGKPRGFNCIHTLESLVTLALEGTPWACRRLNAVETQAVVEEVIREAKDQFTYFKALSQYRGFSRLVNRFLRETIGLTEESIFNHIAEPSKRRDLTILYERYNSLLRDKGLLDEPLSLLKAAQMVREGSSPLLKDVTHLFVDGFYSFTQAQWLLIKALIERIGRGIFTLPWDEERPGLFSLPAFLAHELRELGVDEEFSEVIPGHPTSLLEPLLFREGISRGSVNLKGCVSLVKARGRTEEVRWIAYEIYRLIQMGVPLDEIGVIVKDIPFYRDMITEVFSEWGIPCRISQHPPLAEDPLVGFVVMVLKARIEDLPVSRLVSLALSSFLNLDEETIIEVLGIAERIRYLIGIRNWKERLMRLDGFSRGCFWILNILIPALEGIPEKGRGEEIVAGLWRAISTLGLTPKGRTGEVLRYLREALLWVARGKSLVAERAYSLEEFLFSLSGVLRESHISVPEPEAGVNVMSVVDGRQSFFPYLFFMGLNEGVFPSQAHSDPILGDSERERVNRAYGKVILPPQIDYTLAEERLFFYIGATRALRHLYLSYPDRDDEGRPLNPSPYLLDLLTEVQVEERDPEVRVPFGQKRILDYKRPTGEVGGSVPFPHTFTSTQLEEYLYCPFAYFFRFILEIKPFKVPLEEALSTYIGDLYHEILYRYEMARSGAIGGVREHLELMELLAEEVFDRYLREGKVGHILLFRSEKERHLEHLRNFVRWEEERNYPPPIKAEESVSGEYDGIDIGGRIDRVQEEGDEIVIWDYKTGGLSSFKEKKRLGLLFQPYLYAHLLSERGLRCGKFRYLSISGMSRGGEALELEVGPEERKASLERLRRVVGLIAKGRFPMDTSKIGFKEPSFKCRNCLYDLICRR